MTVSKASGFTFKSTNFAAVEFIMMEKYSILSAARSGTFQERLCQLYMKVGDFIDIERLESRTMKYCKVFLSDVHNQYPQLLDSQLWQEFLSAVPCSIIEQQPLNGSKIAILIKTSDHEPDLQLLPLRLREMECKGNDAYQQTVMLFERYIAKVRQQGLNIADHCVRTWLYVNDIDRNYADVVRARNDVFVKNGLTAETHFITSTGIDGATWVKGATVAMDCLTCPKATASTLKYLHASDHLDDAIEYGVTFERGVRIDCAEKQYFLISGTASIDKYGEIVYPNNIRKQTGRLLENIGALLANGGATMNDIRCFTVYLRDLSDYAEVEKFMSQVFPYTPRIILQARACRPSELVEMECVAIKGR